MLRSLILVLVTCLSSCSIYVGETPLWYDFSGINLEDYENQNFILLPIAAENGEGMDAAGKKALVGSIQSQFDRVFSVKPRYLSPELLASEGFSKPYNNTKIAAHFNAQAILIASVFDVEAGLSRSKTIQYRNVGLKLSCFDAADPYKYWRLSKRYRSNSGFNVKNIDFDFVLYSDFRSIKKVLASQNTSNNAIRLDEKTSPSILVSADDKKVSDEARGGNAFVTSANTFDIQLSVLDAYGLSLISIYDDDNNLLDEIDFSYQTVLSYSKALPVPLKPGMNKIRIDVSNVEQKESSRHIKIKRKVVKSTHVIVVSSPYAIAKDAYFVTTQYLSELNQKISKRYQNLIYLNQGNASRQDVLRTVELLALDAEDDENLNPVFFFSGQVQKLDSKHLGEKYYLMLAESEPRYLRSTAIDLDDVIELLGGNAFVMIEYCSHDQSQLGDYRLTRLDVPIKVNIYSCDKVVGDISSRFIEQYKKNRSLQSIVENEKRDFDTLQSVRKEIKYTY